MAGKRVSPVVGRVVLSFGAALFALTARAATAVVADPHAGGSPAKTAKAADGFWFVVNEDNDHFFKCDASEMTEKGLTDYLDYVLCGKVTHFFMCVNGQRTSYDSKTWEPIWTGMNERARPDTATRPDGTHDRWCVNARRLFDAGIDPYAVWVKYCRTKGVSPWISMRMNDVHFGGDTNYFRNTSFFKAHPEWRIEPDARHGWMSYQLDYAVPEVRAYTLAQVREIAERWDSDGIELDWMRFGHVFRYGHEREDSYHLDNFVRRVRAILDEAGRAHGRRMGLAVRVPPTPGRAEQFGFNVVKWAREGLVDVVIPDGFLRAPVGLPVGDWLKLLEGTRARLVPGTGSSVLPNLDYARLAPSLRGLVDHYARQGATGAYFYNLPYFSNLKYSTDGCSNPKYDAAGELYRNGVSPADTAGCEKLLYWTPFDYPEVVREEVFRFADAIVVVNRATAKTKTGEAWLRDAVADLTNVIRKVTGTCPAVYDEGSEPKDAKAVIYLGDTAAAKAEGIQTRDLRNGDWCLRTVPGKAFLYGKTGMAVSYAVSNFVSEQLGYDFLVMDGDDPFTYDPDRIAFGNDSCVRPALYAREIYTAMWNGKRWPVSTSVRMGWQRRIYGASTDEIEGRYRVAGGPGGCHTIHNYLPPEKFFKDHPDWYSMGPDGKRKGVRNAQSQICYTNPEAKEEVYRSLVAFVEKEYKAHPDNPAQIFDMTQMDNSDFLCLCPECRKVIAKYNRTEGGHKEGGDAGLQLEFFNDLARRIRAQYPDVQLRIFAYVSTECAPKPGTIKVEPNVVIWWCDVYSYSDHTLPLETAGHYNTYQSGELGDWMKLTHNMHIWDYMLYGNSFPEVSPDAIAADARLFASTKIPRIFMETEYHEQAFYELNCYLMGRLYVNPKLDVDRLIRGFCRVYGKGAADMETAIAFLRKIEREQCATTKGDWHSRLLPWLDRANMERLAALFQAAYDKESDPRCRARILGPLAATWKQLVTILKKDPKAKEAFRTAQENYRRYAKELYATGFFEDRDRAKKQAAVDEELEVLTLRFDDIPEALKGVPDSEIVCIDYHATGKSQPDADSSRGYRMSRTPKGSKDTFPIACGVYDFQAKESSLSTKITAEMLPADGKYHWVRIGIGHVGRNTSFWYPGSWLAGVSLKEYHVLADGLDVDPNWYEFWVSMRASGPNFAPDSTDESMASLDRIVLRRVAPPKKK